MSRSARIPRPEPSGPAPARAPVPEPVLSAADRDAAFRQAKRHSRRVHFFRLALPSAALGTAILLLLVFWLDPLRLYRNLPIEFGRITITDNKLTIEAPKLAGFTQDRKPYSITALSAAQDLGKPNIVELKEIEGQVELEGAGNTSLRAKQGIYDIKGESLALDGGIEIDSTGGYRMNLADAFVEVRKGRIVTDKPVDAGFPDGTLRANRLEILDHGGRVRFSGGVSMTLRLPPPRTARAETSQ